MSENIQIQPADIQHRIYEIRGHRVMLDFDLAEMYQTETKRLKEAVRRNIERFPTDFMFELTAKEWEILRTQFATSSWGGARYQPFAFTEQGVAMLASVLKSATAIQVNIQIVRAFVVLRQYALGYAELNQKLEQFMVETNLQFNDIYMALTEMAAQSTQKRNPVGYLSYLQKDDPDEASNRP